MASTLRTAVAAMATALFKLEPRYGDDLVECVATVAAVRAWRAGWVCSYHDIAF
jgi:hypothetical protein